MLFSYLAILFISNNYGAEVFGRFSLLQTLLQFSIVVFSLGLSTLTVKLTADTNFFSGNKPLNSYLKNSLIILFVSSLVGTILFWLFKDIIVINIFNDAGLLDYFNYLIVFFVFAVFHDYLTEFLKGRHRFILYGVFKFVLPSLIFILLLLLCYNLNAAENSVFLSYILGFAVLVIPLLFLFPIKKLNTEHKHSSKSLLLVSYPMMFSAAFLFLSNWTDVFMLGAMASKEDVGIYNAAYKLAILALIIINAVNTILAPKISELYSQGKHQEIKKEVQSATKLITYLTTPVVLILIFFRKPLLQLFGEEFVVGETALIIIAIGLFFNALSGSVGQVLNMTKHQNVLKKITIISVIANILLNYILISRMGFLGAAVASLISNILLNTLCVIVIKREFNFYAFFNPWA